MAFRVETSVADYETMLSYYNYIFEYNEKNPHNFQRIVEVVSARLLAEKPKDVSFNLVVRWTEPGCPVTDRHAAGFGDLSHACKVVKLVQGHFPKVRVFLTSLFSEISERDPRISNLPSGPLKVYDAKEREELFLGVQCPKALPPYLRAHYYGVPTIMLDVATPAVDVYPFELDDLGVNRNGLNLLGCYHIDEYNGQRSRRLEFPGTPSHQWYSAGIGFRASGSLCTGIHVNKSLEAAHLPYSELQKLSVPDIAKWFNTPGEMTPEFYFSYFSVYDEKYAARFLQVINSFESALGTGRDVDVFMLSPGRKIYPSIAKTILWFCRNSCFAEISYILPSSIYAPQLFRVPTPRTLGGRLRVFIWTERVPHEDVLNLMKATGRMMLVSGDQSLAEAISLKDRVIFYEMQDWKKELFAQIVDFAAFYFGQSSSVVDFLDFSQQGFFSNEAPYIIKKLTTLLLDPKFLQRHEELMGIFTEMYDVNKWLLGMLNRRLIEHSTPKIFAAESSVISSIVKGRPRAAKRAYRQITLTVNEWVEKGAAEKRQRTIVTRKVTPKGIAEVPTTYQFRLDLIKKIEQVFF